MMDAVTQIVVWLNVLADALGRWVLAPIGLAPAWFSPRPSRRPPVC